MSKISVIGAGNVGAVVANDLMIQGIASEIVLVDINKKKAFGEAMDIYQGAPFHSPAIVFVLVWECMLRNSFLLGYVSAINIQYTLQYNLFSKNRYEIPP